MLYADQKIDGTITAYIDKAAVVQLILGPGCFAINHALKGTLG